MVSLSFWPLPDAVFSSYIFLISLFTNILPLPLRLAQVNGMVGFE